MINAQTVSYRRLDKGVEEESEHARSVLPFSLFSSVLFHTSPHHCASCERNLEQRDRGVHPPCCWDCLLNLCSLRGAPKLSAEPSENVFSLSLSMVLLWRVWNSQAKGHSQLWQNRNLFFLFPIKALCFWMPVLDVPVLACLCFFYQTW